MRIAVASQTLAVAVAEIDLRWMGSAGWLQCVYVWLGLVCVVV